MRELKITGCKDSSMWYAGLVGQRVPLLLEECHVYLSREPAGYTNIVHLADAKPVWVDLEGREFGDGDAVSCACKATVMTLSHGVTRCQPVGPVMRDTTHTVARCTYDPKVFSTLVHLPMLEAAPELPKFWGSVVLRASQVIARCIVGQKGKGTNGQ